MVCGCFVYSIVRFGLPNTMFFGLGIVYLPGVLFVMLMWILDPVFKYFGWLNEASDITDKPVIDESGIDDQTLYSQQYEKAFL